MDRVELRAIDASNLTLRLFQSLPRQADLFVDVLDLPVIGLELLDQRVSLKLEVDQAPLRTSTVHDLTRHLILHLREVLEVNSVPALFDVLIIKERVN